MDEGERERDLQLKIESVATSADSSAVTIGESRLAISSVGDGPSDIRRKDRVKGKRKRGRKKRREKNG